MSPRARPVIAAVGVVGVITSWCLAPSALAQSATPSSLQFLSPDKVEKSLDGGKSSVTAGLTVQNNSGQSQDVSFSVVGADHSVSVVAPSDTAITPYDSRAFTVALHPSEADEASTGVLLVKAENVEPDTLPLNVKPATTYPAWLFLIVFASLGVALVFVVARWLSFKRDAQCTLKSRMGPVDWKFTDSWASTLTVVGALLGTILASNALPAETSLQPKITYAGLNFLFGVVIVLAPLIYTATAAPVQVTRRNVHGKEPQFQGYIWSFLAASCLTVWATVGELATVFGLFNELRLADSMPLAIVGLLGALVAVAVVLLVRYSWTSIATRLEFQYERKPRRHRRRRWTRAAGRVREVGAEVSGTEQGDVPPLESKGAVPGAESPGRDKTEEALPSFSVL
jgi:hypothetical protein